MPVGMWVMRTAESVVLTDWPPGPTSGRRRPGSRRPGCRPRRPARSTGMTSTAAKLVCRLCPRRTGYPNQPVCARLDREGPVRVRRVHREGRGLDAGLLGEGRVQTLTGSCAVRPSAGTSAAASRRSPSHHRHRRRADRDQRLAGVVLAVKERVDLESSIALRSDAISVTDLGQRIRVALGLGELQQHSGVVQPAAEALGLADLGLHVRQLRRDLLSPRLIVPEGRLGRHQLSPARPSRCASGAGRNGLDGVQDLVEALQLLGVVNFSHS